MPAGTSSKVVVLVLLGCLGLAAYTSHKLYTMARIRGFVGEPSTTSHVVVDKSSERTRRSTTCWLWYEGRQRIQADCDYWGRVGVGDEIQIVSIDGDQYLKDGEIYASEGNFAFDIGLLVAEVAGVIACVVVLLLRRRRA